MMKESYKTKTQKDTGEGMADYTNWLKQCVYRYEDENPLQIFQGAGPGNTSFLFYGTNATTDAQLRDIFSRHGGTYGVRVDWMFQQKGQILVSKLRSGVDENTMMLEGLGAGAERVHFDDGDLMEIITRPNKLQDIVDIFELEDIQILKSMLVWMPRELIPVNDDETITMILGIMDEVTSLEGIVNVTADFWIPDDKLEKLL